MKKREPISNRAKRASIASELSEQKTPKTQNVGRPRGENDTTQIVHTRKKLMKEAKKHAIDEGLTLSDYINQLIEEDLKQKGKF